MRTHHPAGVLPLALAAGSVVLAACSDSGLTTPDIERDRPGVEPFPSPSVVSPIGGAEQIVFTSARTGDNEIFVMSTDGVVQVNLSLNGADDRNPVLSPDGSQVAFASDRDGDSEIYVMNIDGTGLTQLTSNTSGDFVPAWSPDGSKIAFHTDRDGNNEIYSMNADGTGQTNLTNDPGNDLGPDFSPDGTQIAFVSLRTAGDAEIFVMNADGTGQTNVSNAIGFADLSPDWSPDGTKIAFFSTRGPGTGAATHEIMVMNADGTGQTQLTSNTASDRGPAWSLDGTQIAFSSDRDANNEIYVMAANGSGQTNLTNDPGSDIQPDWGVTPPELLIVQIDIKPGSDPNCVNNNGNGVIPVAILGSATFDVTEIDAATVELEGMNVAARGKSNKLLAHIEDSNGDGFDDLVVQIEDVDGVLFEGQDTATLDGSLLDGTPIQGTDDICVVP